MAIINESLEQGMRSLVQIKIMNILQITYEKISVLTIANMVSVQNCEILCGKFSVTSRLHIVLQVPKLHIT